MGSISNIEEVAGDWLARRDREDWTEADQARFDRWLDASPLNRVAYLRLEHVWERSQRLRALGMGARGSEPPPPGQWFSPSFEQRDTTSAATSPAADSAEVFGAARIEPHLRRPRMRLALAASAVVTAVLVLGWYEWPGGTSYRTPVGGLASVPLSDGSNMTLNTDSQVRVSVTEKERQVVLEHGEAYFDVAKDPNRPFVVRVGSRRVVAVGTRFAVRREGEELEVTVTEGKVRLEDAASAPLRSSRGARALPPEPLPAGTVARASEAGVLLEQETLPEAEESLSWREGMLVFRAMTLADAVAEFNRYNTRKVVIDDPRIGGLLVAGRFRATNVEGFTRLLERGYALRVEQSGDGFILKAR